MFSAMKKWITTAALLTVSTLAMAADYEAGTHYKVLAEPVPVMMDGKIHVEEAFWYGCPHCYDLEAKINPWKKALADDVSFERVPAQFRRDWEQHAKLFYTTEALGVNEQLHSQIFEALHLKRLRLLTPEEQRDFVVSNSSVSAEDFDKTYRSFGVSSRMKQADKRVRSFNITGVPALIINGKYIVDASSAGSQEAMLEVADFLINKERTGH